MKLLYYTTLLVGVNAKIPSKCNSDDQCNPVVRGSAPLGEKLCGCFAESDLQPFDQCEWELGRGCQNWVGCITNSKGGNEWCEGTAKCRGDHCYKMEAYCDIALDDNGLGECRLREPEGTLCSDTCGAERELVNDDNVRERILKYSNEGYTFIQKKKIHCLDTSKITKMDYVLAGDSQFQSISTDLSCWDVSSVTSMSVST